MSNQHIEHCHLMAQCAHIAYKDGAEAKSEYKILGFTGHKFFDIDGAQCHAVWNKKMYVLCFRGTEPDEFSDITADLNAWPDKGVSGGWVHNGFQNELEKLWKDLVAHEEKNRKDKQFFICGHSLGGAMATICASRFKETVDCLFTYGSPRAGTTSFVNSFKNVTHYRHKNNNDIVTSVPLWLMGYRHHGTLRYINYYGNIRKMTPWQRIKDQWRGRIAALSTGVPFDGVLDHSMGDYVKYTEKNSD